MLSAEVCQSFWGLFCWAAPNYFSSLLSSSFPDSCGPRSAPSDSSADSVVWYAPANFHQQSPAVYFSLVASEAPHQPRCKSLQAHHRSCHRTNSLDQSPSSGLHFACSSLMLQTLLPMSFWPYHLVRLVGCSQDYYWMILSSDYQISFFILD